MPAMQRPIRLLTWTPLLEPRLARARQPPQSPPCATPNPENCFDCVPEAHASLMRAGRRRHTTERDGTRRTEGHGLPEPCRRAPPLALTLLVAVAHGNRTHRTCLSARATGFEDRAGHQIRTRYRRALYSGSRPDAQRFPGVLDPAAERR